MGFVFQPVSADYPNGLVEPCPQRAVVRTSPWLLAALVLLCLVPRAIMAWRLDGVCPDAVLYIQMAKALDGGDFSVGLREFRLNTYPALLALLHRTGFDMETAGAWSGVVVSSLAVLPLFGWARRQFDGRVALAACFLYAVHPRLVQWSPEIIRDPTFWFLFVLSVYLLWRAVTEVRLILFAAAGLAVGMAILTRFEGVFLAVPMVLWSFWRWLALRRERRRLILGVLLCAAVFPALVVSANLLWLRGHPQWEFARLSPLELARAWVGSIAGSSAEPAAGDSSDVAVNTGQGIVLQQAGLPLKRMVEIYVPTVVKGFSPVFGLLMLFGLWRWRRIWARRDQQPLFYVAVLILAGMWIHLWGAHAICTRYVLPIVMTATVFAGLALLKLAEWCAYAANWLLRGERLARAAAFLPAVAAVAGGVYDVLARDYSLRDAELRLAAWVRREVGPAPRLVGPPGMTATISHYAQGRYSIFPMEADDAAIAAMVRQCKPDVLLLFSTKQPTGERYAPLIDRMKQLRLRQVDASQLPPGCEKVCVLVRERVEPLERVATTGLSGRAGPELADKPPAPPGRSPAGRGDSHTSMQ